MKPNIINYFTKKFNMPFLALLSIVLITFVNCTDEDQTVTELTNLVMSDEFNADGVPNKALWSYDIGTGESGWGNNELQYYTSRPENVRVENGMLLITAIKEDFNGASYTSARLITKGKFEQAYGRFEARMRLPYGQGLWPAFWLLGADVDDNPLPDAGKIGIMEYRGQNPNIAISSLHGPGYYGGGAFRVNYQLENDRFDTGFHIFGIEWGPEYINYYIDNVLYTRITPQQVNGSWVFNKPFFIVINLAIGGNFIGSPNSETVFPQTMLVDYVKVYN